MHDHVHTHIPKRKIQPLNIVTEPQKGKYIPMASPWINSPSNHCLVTQIANTLIRFAPQANVTKSASGDTLQGTPVNHRHQLQGADKDVAVIRVPEEKWNP